jgi:flagellar hook assembly protein FlgD
VLTAVAHTASDANPANDAVTVTLHVGNLTAAPDDAVAVTVHPTTNPFGRETGLRFALPRATEVRVEIFDARGRRVAQLHDGPLDAGPRTLAWDGRDGDGREVPSGVYLYRAQLGAERQVGKLLKTR